MTELAACHICSGELFVLDGYPVAQQVTSDCRPWEGTSCLAVCRKCATVQKPVTAAWRRQIDEIYAHYAVYAQGGGVEQVAFDQQTGAGVARSQKIVDWLRGNGGLADTGCLLDIGCGNGAFLRAFGRVHPRWTMAGLELDARNRMQVEAIEGVTHLHVGPIDSMAARHDLVVLIHALEHIPNPVSYLRSLRGLLKDHGCLLVQVPDLVSSPFDILIADHCSHFDAVSLRRVLELSDFEVLRLEAGGSVAKELTLLARPVSAQLAVEPGVRISDEQNAASMHIAWLHRMLDQGRSAKGSIGIFGTSISATWLAAALGDRVGFFVDEDTHRIGRRHMGRPIFGPKDAPTDASLLMPLRADIALAISRRLGRFDLRFIMPPPPTTTQAGSP